MISNQSSDEELLQIVEQIKRLKTDNEQLRAKSEVFTKEVSSLRFELECAREINEQLGIDLEKHLDTEFHEQIKELDSESEVIATERDRLAEKITNLEDRLSEAARQNATLKLRIKELESGNNDSSQVQSMFDSIKRALQE